MDTSFTFWLSTLHNKSLSYIIFALLVKMKAFVRVQKLSFNDKITAFMA